MNENKYEIPGPVLNRATGQEIPEDEPIFILRAKDNLAVQTLEKYYDLCRAAARENGKIDDLSHLGPVAQRIEEFEAWRKANPSECKDPDTNG